MDSKVISSAILAIGLIVTAFLLGRNIEQYNKGNAVKACYETSTLPYQSDKGNGMYFDKEKYNACMNSMGY
jgi:hypothetical protein